MAYFKVADIPLPNKGREKGFGLDHFGIEIEKTICRVEFTISTRGWRKFALALPNHELANENVQNLHSSVIIIESLVRNTLKVLIKKYKGFPTESIHAEHIMFCIDDMGGRAFYTEIGDDMKTFIIWIDANVLSSTRGKNLSMKEAYQTIAIPLRHEFYHIIAAAQHNQHRIAGLVDSWRKKLEPDADRKKRIISKGVTHFLGYAVAKEALSQDQSREMNIAFQSFFNLSYDQFREMVADSALCIIAMEVGDIEYLKRYMDEDVASMRELKINLNRLKEYHEHAGALRDPKHPDYSMARAMYMKSVMNTLSMMYFFNYLPFSSIAVHALSKSKWHHDHPYAKYQDYYATANRIVENYKQEIRRHFNSSDAGFIKFFEAYAAIAESQAIHMDPLDPNLQQEMYNPEAMANADRAFQILSSQVHFWVSKIEEYEMAWSRMPK